MDSSHARGKPSCPSSRFATNMSLHFEYHPQSTQVDCSSLEIFFEKKNLRLDGLLSCTRQAVLSFEPVRDKYVASLRVPSAIHAGGLLKSRNFFREKKFET